MKEVKFPFDAERCFEKCVKHKNIPRNDFEKQAILIRLIKEFQDNKKYSEQEVNSIIKKYFDDYATVRRELINFGYIQRDINKGEYWVVKRKLTAEDIKNNILLRRYAKSYGILEEK